MKKIISAAVFAAVVVPVKAATEQAKLDTMSVQQISEVVVKAVRAPKNAPCLSTLRRTRACSGPT